eukprot:PhF_6_TR43617/c0_g1_i3/m.67008
MEGVYKPTTFKRTKRFGTTWNFNHNASPSLPTKFPETNSLTTTVLGMTRNSSSTLRMQHVWFAALRDRVTSYEEKVKKQTEQIKEHETAMAKQAEELKNVLRQREQQPSNSQMMPYFMPPQMDFGGMMNGGNGGWG